MTTDLLFTLLYEKCCSFLFNLAPPSLRGCPCKNRPLDFRPKTEFLQIFRVRQLVHVINKNGNNLAFNAVFQYFWRQFQRTVQNRLNRSVSSQI